VSEASPTESKQYGFEAPGLSTPQVFLRVLGILAAPFVFYYVWKFAVRIGLAEIPISSSIPSMISLLSFLFSLIVICIALGARGRVGAFTRGFLLIWLVLHLVSSADYVSQLAPTELLWQVKQGHEVTLSDRMNNGPALWAISRVALIFGFSLAGGSLSRWAYIRFRPDPVEIKEQIAPRSKVSSGT